MFTLTRLATVLLITTIAGSQLASAADKPWYIGSKGGDTRKGVSTYVATTNTAFPAPVTVTTGHIGPKGGDIRRGAFASTQGVDIPTAGTGYTDRSWNGKSALYQFIDRKRALARQAQEH